MLRILPAIFATIGAAQAATFTVFDEAPDASLSVLGTFEAPATGGPLTAASIVYDGITFDILGAGGATPVYDAGDNEVDGVSGFGLVYNSTPFSFSDGFGTYDCTVGLCAFGFEDRGGGYPTNAGEWYIDHPDAPYALGLYQIEPAAVPVPALGGALAIALLGLGSVSRRR